MKRGIDVKKVLRKDAFPIPDNTSPSGSRCFQITIPDDNQWEETFFSCLLLLTKWNSYQQDGGHLAADVATRWRQVIWENMTRCGPNPGPIQVLIDESEYEMSICEQLRFHNGKLQGLCCGEWSDIAGQENITFGGPGQEGGGAEQPGPGACVTYHAIFEANSQYLVPTVVNAGDTLTFTNPDGAGWDGVTLGLWFCPNGQTFFAGDCTGPTITDGADPKPASPHMSFVANIDGTWYDAISGTITVPGGVVNAPITIQVNDATLADNAGSYSLDIEVCNEAPVEWERILNLTLTDGGFTPGAGNGLWVPGTGWTAEDEFDGTNWARHCVINKTWATGVDLTYCDVEYTVTRGPEIVALDDILYIGGVTRDTNPNSSGTLHLIYSGAALPGSVWVQFNCYVSQQATHGALSGSVAATKLTLRGTGTPPF